MFGKVLIANRGEIALRVHRACQEMGIRTVAVHSTADSTAMHVRLADESVCIGPPSARDSYLNMAAILSAAAITGADAIHPGYGFLSENANFAEMVEAHGLAFIGPTAAHIRMMGDKIAAKDAMRSLGVPLVPGSLGALESFEEARAVADEIKYPVLIKAAAGGGGRGMKVARSEEELEEAWRVARTESKAAFGDDSVYMEKYLDRPRHIELQVMADMHGNVVHFGERDCSLQRRHQKLVEEAPAAPLAPGVRERLLADAVRLGERLHYRNVGTVEFIVQGDRYYFLEVNPRLQVEHPVTEEVTGLDVVELMLRIASGEGLALNQGDVKISGHAVETRICAEDAAANFLPSTGRLAHVSFPARGVRVETGVDTGSEVTPWYDPMLAKLITHAPTRDQAMDRMQLALDEMSVFGVITNRDFLKRLLALPETRDGSFHTRLIDERMASWSLKDALHDNGTLGIAAYVWLLRNRAEPAAGVWSAAALTGWQMADSGDGLAPIPALHLQSGDLSAAIRFAPLAADGSLRLAVDDVPMELNLRPLGDDRYLAILGSRRLNVRAIQDGSTVHVQDDAGTHAFEALPYLSYISASSEASGELRAPMMGMILKVNVKSGDAVKAGDVVAVLESMKMEMRICAEADGVVESTHCTEGQTVERNAVVVRIGKAA